MIFFYIFEQICMLFLKKNMQWSDKVFELKHLTTAAWTVHSYLHCFVVLHREEFDVCLEALAVKSCAWITQVINQLTNSLVYISVGPVCFQQANAADSFKLWIFKNEVFCIGQKQSMEVGTSIAVGSAIAAFFYRRYGRLLDSLLP